MTVTAQVGVHLDRFVACPGNLQPVLAHGFPVYLQLYVCKNRALMAKCNICGLTLFCFGDYWKRNTIAREQIRAMHPVGPHPVDGAGCPV